MESTLSSSVIRLEVIGCVLRMYRRRVGYGPFWWWAGGELGVAV